MDIQIDTAVVTPSANVYRLRYLGGCQLTLSQRGIHDIESEMIFKSNPGFIFHDSRGFEAGGDYELRVVKDFIARRAREKKLYDQLHAIW